MWVFRSASADGPYEPVVDAFRLSGGGGEHDSYEFGALAAWCRGRNGEHLVSQYMTTKGMGRSDVWMLPLRKPVVSVHGTLHLEYWEGNEPITRGPAVRVPSEASVRCSDNGFEGAQLEVGWLAALNALQHDIGAVLTAQIESAHGVGALGLALEDVSGGGELVANGTASSEVNFTAVLVDLAAPSTATASTVVRRSGTSTVVLDRSGSFICGEHHTTCGVATLTAVEPGAVGGSVRLFFRKGMWELYVNNQLVQTHIYGHASPLPAAGEGRVGLVCSGHADVKLANIAIHALVP